ncbi:hypothetical protein HK102_000330 [Quaeritorhiza haematococci]|nr:hypothetical protein HK102_000330 [Quaeritorhiza haematococci]
MVKIGEITSRTDQAFSWQISELIPQGTTCQEGSFYFSQRVETADGQGWYVSIGTETDIDIYLKITAPIITTPGTTFSFTLTGGINKTLSEDEGNTFTHQAEYWGWKQFAKRDQWNTFCRSSLELKICLHNRNAAAPDSTRDLYFSMVNDENDSNCSFLVEGKRIYALSPILCRRSEYFKAMLGSKFAEGKFSKDRPIELPNLKYAAVESCLQWMYTGRQWPWCDVSFGKMRDIYTAADIFGLHHLAKGALDVIFGTITLKTYGDIYVFARTFQQTQLATKALAFWKENWAKTEQKGTEANKQAKIIIEHMGSNGEDEWWAFAKWALSDNRRV